jgi:hypothetical protein
MKVLGKKVLIEQTMTKKESKIILMNKDKKDEETFDTTFKVIQMGSECPVGEVAVGDTPIFSKYVDFHGAKVIEEVKDKKVIIHTIVHFEDIIGIE